MKIISPSAHIHNPTPAEELYQQIETGGRICYQSQPKGNPVQFIRNLIARGHESPLEHAGFSAMFICDRGASHEIVRHRVASYCQESTRFCNYSSDKFENEITVIKPFMFEENSDKLTLWKTACMFSEMTYFFLLNSGATPQEARSVLPNSLKTQLMMTANIREWRHFFKLRCAKDAHPQMREVALMLYKEALERYPVLFEDLQKEFE